ncbi:hypothetical protein KBC99_01510 [Candidatus Saccharibacteria bacterium]|nr:hypothetical protein [Candidatus Saccharibacteria bacterium]
MNSGFTSFATRGRISWSGTHQKLDREAFRILAPMINLSRFPRRKNILKFEGYNGPDGMKVKGSYNTDHLWDPINEIGHLPMWIAMHYDNLVKALQKHDYVEAGFHAGWMAHYITDSLTPAHHISYKLIAEEYAEASKLTRRWKTWGSKGWKSSHIAFESGISAATIFTPLRVKFDLDLARAISSHGIEATIKEESHKIAKLGLYEEFIKHGWTAKLAKATRATIVPRIPQMIAAAWLAAYQDAWCTEPKKKLATTRAN